MGMVALDSFCFSKRAFWSILLQTLFLLNFTTQVFGDESTSSNNVDIPVPRAGMLVPLYIYPKPGTWEPLYFAIETHPSIDFVVIINPANGPGVDAVPDPVYMKEIVRLNQYPNVRTIGYVPVNYGRRPIDRIFNDIAKYAGWGQRNPNMAMQGIFLDESPQIADSHNATYVADVRKFLKKQRNLSNGLLIENPGMIPDTQILESADRTVVFEDTYFAYNNTQAARQISALPDRHKLVCLMHSIPDGLTAEQLKSLVAEVRMISGSIFMTDLSTSYYHRFSPRFLDFVNALMQDSYVPSTYR